MGFAVPSIGNLIAKRTMPFRCGAATYAPVLVAPIFVATAVLAAPVIPPVPVTSAYDSDHVGIFEILTLILHARHQNRWRCLGCVVRLNGLWDEHSALCRLAQVGSRPTSQNVGYLYFGSLIVCPMAEFFNTLRPQKLHTLQAKNANRIMEPQL